MKTMLDFLSGLAAPRLAELAAATCPTSRRRAAGSALAKLAGC